MAPVFFPTALAPILLTPSSYAQIHPHFFCTIGMGLASVSRVYLRWKTNRTQVRFFETLRESCPGIANLSLHSPPNLLLKIRFLKLSLKNKAQHFAFS
ncbi:MAG: hypothetical protein EBQ85_11160 [Proteobacteria bacterium]|nr:hypothetical protein [Pseudomonadota bacterium]